MSDSLEAGQADSGGAALGVGVGLGLLVAFSPTLVEGVQHALAHPWARGMLPFLLLVPWAVAEDRPIAPPRFGRGLVYGALAAALLLQVVAIGGDALRIARAGLVFALALSIWGLGWGGRRSALLALWLLPLPSFAIELGSPWLESGLGQGAAFAPGVEWASSRAGASLSATGAVESVSLAALDGGLALLWGALGLAVFRSIETKATLAGWLRHAGLAACSAVIGQVGLLCVAACLTRRFGEAGARALLDQGGWLLLLVAGLGLLARAIGNRRAPARSRTGGVA